MIRTILEQVARVGRSRRDTSHLSMEQAEKLGHLQNHGYVMFDHLVGTFEFESMKADYQRRIEQEFEFEMPCLSQTKIDPDRDKDLVEGNFFATNKQLQDRGITFDRPEFSDYDDAISKFAPSTLKVPIPDATDYFSLWLEPEMLDIVEAYMGFTPILTEAYIRRNYPARFKVMNHVWHRDRNHQSHLLKGFIFFSDCTLRNGPHHFIAGSVNDSKLQNKNYYTEEEVFEAYPKSSNREVISEVKAGTIILEDTRGLHKAGVPEEGYRDLGFSVFLPPMAFKNWGALYTLSQRTYNGLTSHQQKFIPKSNISAFN